MITFAWMLQIVMTAILVIFCVALLDHIGRWKQISWVWYLVASVGACIVAGVICVTVFHISGFGPDLTKAIKADKATTQPTLDEPIPPPPPCNPPDAGPPKITITMEELQTIVDEALILRNNNHKRRKRER